MFVTHPLTIFLLQLLVSNLIISLAYAFFKQVTYSTPTIKGLLYGTAAILPTACAISLALMLFYLGLSLLLKVILACALLFGITMMIITKPKTQVVQSRDVGDIDELENQEKIKRVLFSSKHPTMHAFSQILLWSLILISSYAIETKTSTMFIEDSGEADTAIITGYIIQHLLPEERSKKVDKVTKDFYDVENSLKQLTTEIQSTDK